MEVILEAMSYVERKIKELGGLTSMRCSSDKDGYTISNHGHFIMEAEFHDVQDIQKLDEELNHVVGIIDTSLFVGLTTFILSVDEMHVHKMERRIL